MSDTTKHADKKALQEVWNTIGEFTLLNGGAPDYGMDIKQRDTGVEIHFYYETEEARDFIYAMRKEILKKGIWFDSGFLLDSPVLEWSLDYSCHYAKNEMYGRDI